MALLFHILYNLFIAKTIFFYKDFSFGQGVKGHLNGKSIRSKVENKKCITKGRCSLLSCSPLELAESM